MNIFETMFRKPAHKPAEVGRAASTLNLLAGADAGDGEGPLVMPKDIYRDQRTGPQQNADRLAALKAAEQDGVVWDATTATMQRVGTDGLPVEKQQ